MSKYRRVRLFLDTDSQIAIVAMETVQLVLSQLKKLFNAVNSELNEVSFWRK